jgi:hypothetical protein
MIALREARRGTSEQQLPPVLYLTFIGLQKQSLISPAHLDVLLYFIAIVSL